MSNFGIWKKKRISELEDSMKTILPEILKRHIFCEDAEGDRKKQLLSLNAKIGSKHREYMDITNRVIASEDEFVSYWLDGFMKHVDFLVKSSTKTPLDSYQAYKFYKQLQSDEKLFEYTELFLRRTFWRYCDSLVKERPNEKNSAIWIGQKNADYGLLITPRFVNGQWENDVSEIRHFKPLYWTIGHVLKTGLVIPDKNKVKTFSSVEDYLEFFEIVLVRNSGSPYEMMIAEKYCDFVRNSDNPNEIPLLIPEFRYGGKEAKHKYRLDFTIINPYTLQKQGFELSPWSTHGALTHTKEKSQKQINEEARENFENEMKKLQAYYREFGVYTVIYTDSSLENMDSIFDEIKSFLSPEHENKLLLSAMKDKFKNYKVG